MLHDTEMVTLWVGDCVVYSNPEGCLPIRVGQIGKMHRTKKGNLKVFIYDKSNNETVIKVKHEDNRWHWPIRLYKRATE